jgi:hypothetical protein
MVNFYRPRPGRRKCQSGIRRRVKLMTPKRFYDPPRPVCRHALTTKSPGAYHHASGNDLATPGRGAVAVAAALMSFAPAYNEELGFGLTFLQG